MNGEQLCATPGTIAPEAFFAHPFTPAAESAVALCAACPAQQACAAYARAEGVTHGIWGGESGPERERWWAEHGGRPEHFQASVTMAARETMQQYRDYINFDRQDEYRRTRTHARAGKLRMVRTAS